jgi:hypothetical protein
MNIELIRERVKRFRPFAVVSSSGDKYPVPHPEFIFLFQRTIVVGTERGTVVVLDPLHIVGLEDIPPHKNGRRKRGHHGH